MRNPDAARSGAAVASVVLCAVTACTSRLSEDDAEAARASPLLRQNAESFIALLQSADPVAINERLADGLEFNKRWSTREGEWYSFCWKGESVSGTFTLESYKDPKRLNLTIEEDGAKIRISIIGRLRYEHFILTGGGVSYNDGEIGEVLADLKAGGRRLERAARWLQTHPRPEVVPDLIEMWDEHYEVKGALRLITFQRLWRTVDWERWYEKNASRSREEWRADAREECLALLESGNLSDRIVGARLARIVTGLEKDVRKAVTFPDEAYATTIVKDESGYALVITNRTSKPALIAVIGDRCSVEISMKPAKADGPRMGGVASWASFPVQYRLRILKPAESLVKRFKLPQHLVPGEYHFTVSVRDMMNGRKYEASFDLSVP